MFCLFINKLYLSLNYMSNKLFLITQVLNRCKSQYVPLVFWVRRTYTPHTYCLWCGPTILQLYKKESKIIKLTITCWSLLYHGWSVDLFRSTQHCIRYMMEHNSSYVNYHYCSLLKLLELLNLNIEGFWQDSHL